MLADHFFLETKFLRVKRTQMRIEHFQVLSMIGSGGFGHIFLCRKKDTGEILAVKKMPQAILKLRNKAVHIKNERDVLAKSYSSPWLVHLVYSFQDETSLYLAMEYIPGGDLRSLLDNIGVLASECVRFYATQMIKCILALHKLGYIHRDLKPSNFLIDKMGFLKLADFGLSKYGWETSKGKAAGREKASNKHLQVVGSPNYIPVEVLRREGCDFGADWWSFGVMLYEMAAGVQPFDAPEPEDIFRNILNYRTHLVYPEGLEETVSEADAEGTVKDNSGESAKGKEKKIERNGEEGEEIGEEGVAGREEAVREVGEGGEEDDDEEEYDPLAPQVWRLVQQLLTEPEERLGQKGLASFQSHPFFADIQWKDLRDHVNNPPPFVPTLDGESDTTYFEDVELFPIPIPTDMPSGVSVDTSMDMEGANMSFAVQHNRFVGFTFKRIVPELAKALAEGGEDGGGYEISTGIRTLFEENAPSEKGKAPKLMELFKKSNEEDIGLRTRSESDLEYPIPGRAAQNEGKSREERWKEILREEEESGEDRRTVRVMGDDDHPDLNR